MRSVVLVIMCLALALGAVGCGASTPAASPATQPAATAVVAPTTAATIAATEAPAATTATSGGAANSAGTLAQAGRGVYNQHCAMCHGQQGEGTSAPAVFGANASLEEYATGKGLYDYVHQAMPLTAPSSLTDEQYLQVVTFMLLEDDLIDAGATVDQSTLEQVQIQ